VVNEKHLDIITKGANTWNEWIMKNAKIIDLSGVNLSRANLGMADFSEANLSRADFSEANLSRANLHEANLGMADLSRANLHEANLSRGNLHEANLSEADLHEANLRSVNLREANLRSANLTGADLREANLREANLSKADLSEAIFVKTNIEKSDLTGCRIYGISAWDLKLQGAIQKNLIITHDGDSTITVDNLEVAQFIYLLLKNENIRNVIDTITSKTVLILGRFTPERKAILDAIKNELRNHNYLPILFDFEKPTNKDFTETIMTLAGMCRFIIVDITNPKSSPLELQAIVPNYMIPFVPIIQEGEQPFSMFKDLANKHEWILDTLVYDSIDNLVIKLENAVIQTGSRGEQYPTLQG
jgi:uncharacterized protein YjbI with pentapeptide repeats